MDNAQCLEKKLPYFRNLADAHAFWKLRLEDLFCELRHRTLFHKSLQEIRLRPPHGVDFQAARVRFEEAIKK